MNIILDMLFKHIEHCMITQSIDIGMDIEDYTFEIDGSNICVSWKYSTDIWATAQHIITVSAADPNAFDKIATRLGEWWQEGDEIDELFDQPNID